MVLVPSAFLDIGQLRLFLASLCIRSWLLSSYVIAALRAGVLLHVILPPLVKAEAGKAVNHGCANYFKHDVSPVWNLTVCRIELAQLVGCCVAIIGKHGDISGRFVSRLNLHTLPGVVRPISETLRTGVPEQALGHGYQSP